MKRVVDSFAFENIRFMAMYPVDLTDWRELIRENFQENFP